MSATDEPMILLASSSRYRAEMLARVVPSFTQAAPDIDEIALAGELPSATAERLAAQKALTIAATHPGHLVIGSDQVAELDGIALGKPGTVERAQAQLSRCSGRSVNFHTALCLVDGRGPQPVLHRALDTTRVVFRELDAEAISRYIALDQPLDCAGSFKVERLGVALFERVENNDPSALVGLPLISLCALLRQAGVQIP